MYIDSQSAFDEFAQEIVGAQLVAIDTEFLRERTYYARLCLLQLNCDGRIVIVDALKVHNLTALRTVFEDPATVKLFHAASQDLEILEREVGVMPVNIFDTQIAAALLGHVQQVGYGALVSSVCGVQLKKADSFTDWSRRPLTESQLDYAADDVRYLPQIYTHMTEQLESLGRSDWLAQDFEDMARPGHFHADPRTRFLRLKRVNQLSGKQLAAARELAAWREAEAVKRDIPRKWVLTDEQIVEACKREATTIDQLFMVRGVREKLSTREAREVVAAMARGINLPSSEWPKLERPSRSEKNVDSQVDLMMAVARQRAKDNNVALQTLVSHDDLVALARGHREGLELLKGWRKRLIGDELCKLVDGHIALRIGEHGVEIVSDEGALDPGEDVCEGDAR